MKNKASSFLKQIISVITTVAKAKSLALKSKTSALKTRLLVFSLLRNKKVLMASISHKLHALVGQQEKTEDDQSKAIVVYNAMANESLSSPVCTELVQMEDYYGYDEEEGDEKYPDLTHSLFDSGEEQEVGGSVIEMVKNSKEQGENFVLEDEIDQVADLFIKRFHKQMRIQKQQSFKRYQEMLERSV
ncbi:hypothetical protein VitviT2T_022099 [Vitis vinifera]|uniref:DUF761 domain-containing protein n=2 Tax=Vitis vinifera TaxID=29760 RepID=A5BL79_VITVI|eukprot:XP_002276426.1 PREDICTED: uncharacterized protein LOC100253147 [Vitis vinifera]